MITIQGKGVSAGVGVGPLYFYRRATAEIKRYTVEDTDAEWHRFKGAQTGAIEQLGVLAEQARKEAGDEAARIQALGRQLQAMGMADFVRACAAQDGTVLPEELFVTESSDLGGFQVFLQGAETPEAAPEAPAQPPEPDPDAGKHAFEVFLDCIAMDDGLVQYLIDVLKRMDRAEFFKLSQITTKLDLDPEEFLYWLGRRELYAGEEEQACAVMMDHALLRLAEEGRLDVVAALLSGQLLLQGGFAVVQQQILVVLEVALT